MKVGFRRLGASVARGLAVLCAAVFVTSARPARAGINVWTRHGPGESGNTSVTALAIDPLTPSTLYAGTSACVPGSDGTFSCTGNLFKTTDGGTNWTASAAGLPSLPLVTALAIDPRTPATLYAGTHGAADGLFKSTDGGANWTLTGLETPTALAIDPHTPTTLYAGSTGQGILKSTDGGGTWGSVNPSPGNYTVVEALAIDPATPSTLYAGSVYGGGYALKSMDGGSTWKTVYAGLTDGVGAFAIDPDTPTTLYAAGYYGGGVFKSTDGGGSWRRLNVEGRVLAIDRLTPRTLYAAGKGVFRSTDGGANWRAFNSGLTNDDVHALAVAATMPPTLYAATGNGVFAIQSPTFAVDSAADAADATPGDGLCAAADGTCTLRAAVDEANAQPGADTIALAGATYLLRSGTLAMTDDLTVVGSGPDRTIIEGDGAHTGTLVTTAGRTTISGVTIQNGHGSRGGGIVNNGDLELINVTISDNTSASGDSAPSYGGGILNDGTLALTDVTISGNTVGPGIGPPVYGGGLYNSGSATLTNVTISGNTAHTRSGSATWGGGIYNSGTLTATNSTISGNTATEDNHRGGRGGGIYNDGSATFLNVTISGNRGDAAVDAGGGIVNSAPGGDLTLEDTLVADNPAGGDCSGPMVSQGHNLDSDGTCGLSAPGDVGDVDPMLGPLQDNGGPTFTQALLPDSPAINAGSADCPPPATDQRGMRRTPPCDIGAYESVPVSCAGDCDEHATVTVDELVAMVNIALDRAPVAECDAGDTDHDMRISIAEILAAVNNALRGCGAR